MQLFIISEPESAQQIVLTDSSLIHQISRVLRMREGAQCTLQWEDTTKTIRGLYEISELGKKQITLNTLSDSEIRKKTTDCIMAIALPNKRSKAELIIQKLAEIGVSEVIWFPAERSQYRTLPSKKLERMKEISKEATEQSRGWRSMNIKSVGSIEEVFECYSGSTYRVCDILPDEYVFANLKTLEQKKSIVFVGPEGGRGPQDYSSINKNTHSLMNLGKTVLRMETAAIVAGWRVVNGM